MQHNGEGSIQEEEEFDGAMVHCMENVMILSIDAHYLFNKLQLWYFQSGISGFQKLLHSQVESQHQIQFISHYPLLGVCIYTQYVLE
jgi:hypothetical protein